MLEQCDKRQRIARDASAQSGAAARAIGQFLTQDTKLKRKIIAYHKDDEGHWVADLECGHTHHLRHIPPFFNRAWVLDSAERKRRLGWTLNCADCEAPNERQLTTE